MQDTKSIRWSYEEALKIFNMPFLDLISKAQQVHKENFSANEIQVSSLCSIKTGSCPEDCKYCSQSAHYKTALEKAPLMDLSEVITQAQKAKSMGSTRFCMGAAWRGPRNDDISKVCEMILAVKALGMETCATLGLLKDGQAEQLKEAGLDFYNHNIDTSPEYYDQIITTRTFEQRLETLEKVRQAGIKVCSGTIVGLGETNEDRVKSIVVLANLDIQPESVPINMLIRIAGTPLANVEKIDQFDFIRTICLARITMPKSYVRLSAGRSEMSDETQALCFLAGANSIFYGEKLLTADNPMQKDDIELFNKLNLKAITL